MNPKLCACLFLAVSLSYAAGCGYKRNFVEKTFDNALYASVTGSSYLRAYFEFMKFSFRGNDQKASFPLGGLIVQIEKPCESGAKRMVFSREMLNVGTNNPPQPESNLVKLDYQLAKSGTFYTKRIMAMSPWWVSRQVNRFFDELKCLNKSFIDKWFYVVYHSHFPYGFAEIRVQKASPYTNKKKSRCPPDDSNIEKLCKGDTSYPCPNMTFQETNGVGVRNISMYLVTGKPSGGVNCSFNSARYSQYMGNHYYFMGNNTQSKKMLRTIPVMTKAIRISSHPDPCQKKYQMQFYVNTAHLDEHNMPCPTQNGVMLQKVENMQIYVKTLNGDPDTDMSQVKDMFTKELDRKNLPYVKGSHYIAQYRGHGPMFGRTMEIWVEKSEPRYITICEGSNGPPSRPPLAVDHATTGAPHATTTSGPMMVSYELA